MPELPLIDRVKIQAEVLVPLVKAMERSMGTAEAHGLVREAMSEESRQHARRLVDEHGGSAEALLAHSADSAGGDANTVEWHELTDDIARLDVTECAYARFYQDLGEPQLGHLLVCEADDWLVDGLEDIELERHGTIMQGSERCDFCFRRVAVPDSEPAASSEVRDQQAP